MEHSQDTHKSGGGDIHRDDTHDEGSKLTANPDSGVNSERHNHVDRVSILSASDENPTFDEVSLISGTDYGDEGTKKHDVLPNDDGGDLNTIRPASAILSRELESAALFSAIPADISIASVPDINRIQTADKSSSTDPALQTPFPPPRMDSLAARDRGVKIPSIPESSANNWPLRGDGNEEEYELHALLARDLTSPIPEVRPASNPRIEEPQSNRNGREKSGRRSSLRSDFQKELPEITVDDIEAPSRTHARIDSPADRAESSASMHVPAARSFGGTLRHKRRLSSVAHSVDAASRRSCTWRPIRGARGLRVVVVLLIICAALTTPPITIIAISNRRGEASDSGAVAWLCLFLIVDAALVGMICLYYRGRKNRVGQGGDTRDEEDSRGPSFATRVASTKYTTYQNSRPPTPMPMLGGYGYRERDLGPSRLREYIELDHPTGTVRNHSSRRPFAGRASPRPLVRSTSSKIALVAEGAGHTGTGQLDREASITTILCDAIVSPFSPVDRQRVHAAPYLHPEQPPRSLTRQQKHMTCDSYDIALGRIPM